MIGIDQQHNIFRDVDADVRKIILSTNIAESSLTVPNVGHGKIDQINASSLKFYCSPLLPPEFSVIDFCLTKTIQTDSATNFSSLCLDWASRNNLRQRSGRAGRVMDGRCYRLIPKHMFESYLPESEKPELLRSPLENIILKTKLLDMGPPHQLLALAMDTPKLSNIADTVLVLKELGALLNTTRGKVKAHDGDITFMGVVMANLPIDVRLSRLIILGYMFSVLDETIIMGKLNGHTFVENRLFANWYHDFSICFHSAAGLNVRSIFTQSIHDTLGAYSRKLEWSNGTGSDLFAIYNAYNVWTFKHNQKDFGTTLEEQKQAYKLFGQKHCIEVRSLKDCHALVEELKQRLINLGIEAPTGVNRAIWTEQHKTIILKVVIGGAFYPNIFLRSTPVSQKYDADVFNLLNGRDPYTTVFYQGFSEQYIREMYTTSIKQLIGNGIVDKDDMHKVKVSFDAQCERVFVTFKQHDNGNAGAHWMTRRSKIPGKIATEVYKAIKMRKLRMPRKIRVMR